jgi:hypothetical protein
MGGHGMTPFRIQAAKDWSVEQGVIPGGSIVEIDTDDLDAVVIDGVPLRMTNIIWNRGGWKNSRMVGDDDFYVEPSIEGDLPMENGAVITVCWGHNETTGIQVGKYAGNRGDEYWIPLIEEEDHIRYNRLCSEFCRGNHCREACMSKLLDDFQIYAYTHQEILDIWKRVGSKLVKPWEDRLWRIESHLTPSGEVRVDVKTAESVALGKGQTITLEQYWEIHRA